MADPAPLPSDGRNPAEGDPYPPEQVKRRTARSKHADDPVRRDWGTRGPMVDRDAASPPEAPPDAPNPSATGDGRDWGARGPIVDRDAASPPEAPDASTTGGRHGRERSPSRRRGT